MHQFCGINMKLGVVNVHRVDSTDVHRYVAQNTNRMVDSIEILFLYTAGLPLAHSEDLVAT